VLDLTPKELEANLWCLHVVAAGYGHEPPGGSVLDSLKRKLLNEAQAIPRKAADIPGYEVAVKGKGW
jgi:hypothetical protein